MYKYFNVITNIKYYKHLYFYRLIFLKKIKHFKYKHEKLTVFHVNKKIFSNLKKHTRTRKIFFFHIKKNSNTLFLFNKPKSTLVKSKKRK